MYVSSSWWCFLSSRAWQLFRYTGSSLRTSASLSLLLWSLCFSSNRLVYFKCSPGRHHEIVLELLRSICLKPGTYCSRMLSRLWNINSKFSCSSSASARPVWKSTSFLWTMSAIKIIFFILVAPHGLQLKSIPLHVLSTVVFSLLERCHQNHLVTFALVCG